MNEPRTLQRPFLYLLVCSVILDIRRRHCSLLQDADWSIGDTTYVDPDSRSTTGYPRL